MKEYRKRKENEGTWGLPVAFVNAEQPSGSTRISCCGAERRALNTAQQGPVSVLEALQQHGVNGLSWQTWHCKEMLGGRNGDGAYTEGRTQRGLFRAGVWRVSSQRGAVG